MGCSGAHRSPALSSGHLITPVADPVQQAEQTGQQEIQDNAELYAVELKTAKGDEVVVKTVAGGTRHAAGRIECDFQSARGRLSGDFR